MPRRRRSAPRPSWPRASVAEGARPPCIYVLAGTNGAGKSSLIGAIIERQGAEFFNPDAAARRLRQHDPGLTQAEANSAATIVLIVPLLIFSRTYRERAGRKIVSEKTLMNWVVATGPPSLSGRLQLMAHLATSATGGISSVRH